MITVSLFVLIVDTPIKVESFVTKKQNKSALLDDPRPPEFRNLPGYSDSVLSCVANCVAATQDHVAIRYLYQCADLQAAGHHHDYCETSSLEYYVDRANQLTSQEAADLEKTTRAQSRSSLWHAGMTQLSRMQNFRFCLATTLVTSVLVADCSIWRVRCKTSLSSCSPGAWDQ